MSQNKIISWMFATYVAALLAPFVHSQYTRLDPTMSVIFSFQWFYLYFALISVLVIGSIGAVFKNDQLMDVATLNIALGIAGSIGDYLLDTYNRTWISASASVKLPVAICVIFSIAIIQVIAGIIKHVLANRREGKMMIHLEFEDYPTPRIANTASETIFASLFGILMLAPAYTRVLMTSSVPWATLLTAGFTLLGVILTTWVIWKIEQKEKTHQGDTP